MSDPFPPYEHDSITTDAEDAVDQLGEYGEILEDGHDRGLFGVTPNTENARPVDDVRRRTIAMQLWLLGYLEEDPDAGDAPISSSTLRDALRRFWDEAGIGAPESDASDAIDDETWYALNELVTFEGMTGTALTEERLRERWFEEGTPRPALRRAVQLRLFVLGLREEKPESELGPLTPDILTPLFWVNLLFELGDRTLSQRYGPAALALLFDQDRFVEALSEAGSDDEFQIRRPESLSKARARRIAQSFIINVAKIELWLLGFDVSPDGKADYSVSGLGGRARKTEMQEALAEYWRELEQKSRHRAETFAESITPALFHSLQKTTEEAEAVETDPEGHRDYSREVVEEHLATEEEIERAWSEVQGRRLSLWDGLKRVWRWIKRGVKKVVSWVGSFFKNLARAFYRYASKGYKIVRLAVTSVVDSVEYFLEGGLTSEPEGTVVLVNEKDFDATVYVDEAGGGEPVPGFLRRMRRKTAVFEFGARILGVAVQTIRQVALGIVGWARLLKSLVQSLRDLKPYYEQLKELHAPARS